jgi:hypothetical protein
MYPTRAQVKARFQHILDDPLGQVFDETVFAGVRRGVRRAEERFPAVPGPEHRADSELHAASGHHIGNARHDGHLTDMGDFEPRERVRWHDGQIRELVLVDRLPQRDQGHLRAVLLLNDTIFFVGATGNVDLQLKYDASGTAPTTDATLINVDGSLTFSRTTRESQAHARDTTRSPPGHAWLPLVRAMTLALSAANSSAWFRPEYAVGRKSRCAQAILCWPSPDRQQSRSLRYPEHVGHLGVVDTSSIFTYYARKSD